MKKAIFPGTFDPPHLGHLDIIRRASSLFDHVTVAIGYNLQKEDTTFTSEERVSMLRKLCRDKHNIEVIRFKGLLVDLLKEQPHSFVIRSLRNSYDFENETIMTQMNRKLGKIETIYMMADEPFLFISSTLLREVARFGSPESLKPFIPEPIIPEVYSRLSEKVEKV